MKGLSELLIIVVTVIVILIAAFVVVSIFGKGTTGIVDTADKVRVTGECQFTCAATCTQYGQQSGDITGAGRSSWDGKTVRIGDKLHKCTEFVDACNCGAPLTVASPQAK